MSREKEKVSCLDKGIEIEIKALFPSSMKFYALAGLSMSTQSFYAIMRGEDGHPNDVTAVELGYIKAQQVINMPVDDLCRVLIENVGVLNPDDINNNVVIESLRVIVARLI